MNYLSLFLYGQYTAAAQLLYNTTKEHVKRDSIVTYIQVDGRISRRGIANGASLASKCSSTQTLAWIDDTRVYKCISLPVLRLW